jgi:hypothetical protein
MSKTNERVSWKVAEHWGDEVPDEGETDDEMRLGGSLGGMSFWDALLDELEWQRCGRA